MPCEGEPLVATLDEGDGATGLLVVSGGGEVRAGAHRGMALLAARLAADGVPVLRFDRRGVGDSGGADPGYATSGPDIAAAAAALRREQPHVARLVGLGNCDAATALALFGRAAGLDALVLANPWLVERGPDGLPPPAAIRAHYVGRLRSPREWRRLFGGGVDITGVLRGLRSIAARPHPNLLAARFLAGCRDLPVTIVLAKGDATAIAARDALRGAGSLRIVAVDTASHSFAGPGDAAALEAAVRAALAG